MKKISTFEDLKVWQDASDLAVEVYNLCSTGKIAKDYGLKDQIQRASISISNNISEGYEYENNKDFIKFLRYAKGSAGEVRSMFNILFKAHLIDEETYHHFFNELIGLSKQIRGFMGYLRKYEKQSE
jgi:four helix bundle protein